MAFLVILGLIGLLAIVVALRAVATDGYAQIATRRDDGFDPAAGYPAQLKGRA